MEAKKRTFAQRVRRFWQSLTGSGTTTYGDEPFPGARDSGLTENGARREAEGREHGGPVHYGYGV